jgi:Protein of unknown function (DUF3455)
MKTNNFKSTWFGLFPLLLAQMGLPPNKPQQLYSPPRVPKNLQVSMEQTLVSKVSAKGVQIYQCKPRANNPNQFEWNLKAPQADLFDIKGQKIGTHYKGPTWEANDGSKVVGEVKSKADSPNKNAIPWLLLSSKSNQGNGIFSNVKYIQRVDTVGGKAPLKGCARTNIGAEVSVNYTSDYYFYGSLP